MMSTVFDPTNHAIQTRWSSNKIAVLSIDVEHDYNGNRTDALDRLPDLLAAIRQARLPLTAFVEGRLFTEQPDLCRRLAEAGTDLHLHCYDHRESGDTADSLRRSIDTFENSTHARPRGYRAHTYRLTEEIFKILVAEGFAWDSSILPGLGLGNYRGKTFRRGDWFVFDDALAEFPVASWRALGIPFIQSYRQLLGPATEALLNRVATLPDLLIYDMHMVDLVCNGRIGASPLPLWLKSVHAWVRFRRRGFDDLTMLGEYLRARGYEWMTLSHCHERLTEEGRWTDV